MSSPFPGLFACSKAYEPRSLVTVYLFDVMRIVCVPEDHVSHELTSFSCCLLAGFILFFSLMNFCTRYKTVYSKLQVSLLPVSQLLQVTSEMPLLCPPLALATKIVVLGTACICFSARDGGHAVKYCGVRNADPGVLWVSVFSVSFCPPVHTPPSACR